ncbi:hypothetical protein [Magpiepox virus 2]|nr:hypothetical protein [Magpiepox virus 2]
MECVSVQGTLEKVKGRQDSYKESTIIFMTGIFKSVAKTTVLCKLTTREES